MIKCRIFTGTKFPENGEIRFLTEGANGENKIDEGYEDYFDKKEFELKIKKFALPMGKFIDAYDKDNKLFWSNYREVEEVEIIDIEVLKAEYKQLSGEEAKGNWGVPKLTKEINLLKQT